MISFITFHLNPGAVHFLTPYVCRVIIHARRHFRKFQKITVVTQIEEEIIEEISVTDWNEGEISEVRIYSDSFDHNDIEAELNPENL